MSAIDRAALIRALPYARRYARALTGSQARGDAVVAVALRQVLAMPDADLTEDAVARVTLYGAIGDHVRAMGVAGEAEGGSDAMSLAQRMLLLLTALMSRCMLYKIAGIDTTTRESSYSTTDDRSGL